jgi:predicted negative regulator of RcsB-dependent stress response
MVEDLSDQEQEELLRNWWRENWKWIAAGVVLGLGLLGGWQYWQVYKTQRAERAAKLYQDFQGAMSRGEADQAGRLLDDLAKDHASSAYTQQGRLLLAKQHADAGKYDEAIAQLRTVASETKDKELAQVARLRSARLLVQQGKHDDALKLLDVESAGSFTAQVRELRGDALFAKGDAAGARAEYAAALAAGDDVQIDRATLELKLQEVGGDTRAEASAAATATKGQP